MSLLNAARIAPPSERQDVSPPITAKQVRGSVGLFSAARHRFFSDRYMHSGTRHANTLEWKVAGSVFRKQRSVRLLTTGKIRCGIGAKQPEPVVILFTKQCVDCCIIQHGANVKDVTATCRFQ